MRGQEEITCRGKDFEGLASKTGSEESGITCREKDFEG